MSDLDWLNSSRPTQLTRDDLDNLTPEQVSEAHRRGHLQDLLAPKPSPFEGKEDELLDALRTGILTDYIEATRNLTHPTTEENN